MFSEPNAPEHGQQLYCIFSCSKLHVEITSVPFPPLWEAA